MKLLAPQQKNEVQKREETLKLLRVKELTSLEENLRKNIAKLQADESAIFARIQAKMAIDEEEHLKTINARQNEVLALEERKRIALKPLEEDMERIKAKFAELERFEKDLKAQEERNEDLADQLQDKLDEIGQKESDLIHRAEIIMAKEKGIADQQALTRESVQTHNRAMIEFESVINRKEADINERNKQLTLKELSLQAQEEKINAIRATQSNLARQLEDERLTLKEAWEELERKKKAKKR